MTTTTETRTCKSCKGLGEHVSPAFTSEGKRYPERRRRCYICGGKGTHEAPDFTAIAKAIAGRAGKLRSKRPADARAYYVWRMARFHGGADVTMPIMAGVGIHGDPFENEMGDFAAEMAKKYFGTDFAGAHRWGVAMGHIQRPVPGLPASAYACGPVADTDKPIEEIHELLTEDEIEERVAEGIEGEG